MKYSHSSGKTTINRPAGKPGNMDLYMYGATKGGSRVVGNRNGHRIKRFKGKNKQQAVLRMEAENEYSSAS